MEKPDKMFLIVVNSEQEWGNDIMLDRIADALRTEEINATIYEVNKEDA